MNAPASGTEGFAVTDTQRVALVTGSGKKRVGWHVAAAVLSLVENEFVTGVGLPVDGGLTIYAAGN